MAESDDVLVDALASLVAALLDGRHTEADEQVAALRVVRHQERPRPNLPKATIARVFVRDRFTCRYCGVRTIPTVVLRVLSSLYPAELPYDLHWKAAHPCYWKITSSAITSKRARPVATGATRRILRPPATSAIRRRATSPSSI